MSGREEDLSDVVIAFSSEAAAFRDKAFMIKCGPFLEALLMMTESILWC